MFDSDNILAEAASKIEYPPELIYFDKRLEVCHQLCDEYFSDWDFNDKSLIKLFTPNKNEFFQSHCKHSVFAKREVDHIDDYRGKAENIFKFLTDNLDYEILSVVRTRLRYFARSNLETEGLRELLFSKIVKEKPALYDELLEDFKPDSRFSFEFEGQELHYKLAFGPVDEEEVRSNDELSKLFPDESKIPGTALYFDIQGFQREVPRTEVSQIMNKTCLQSQRKFKSLLKYLKGGDDLNE